MADNDIVKTPSWHWAVISTPAVVGGLVAFAVWLNTPHRAKPAPTAVAAPAVAPAAVAPAAFAPTVSLRGLAGFDLGLTNAALDTVNAYELQFLIANRTKTNSGFMEISCKAFTKNGLFRRDYAITQDIEPGEIQSPLVVYIDPIKDVTRVDCELTRDHVG